MTTPTLSISQEIRDFAADYADPPLLDDSVVLRLALRVAYDDPDNPGTSLAISPMVAIEYCNDALAYRPDMAPERARAFRERVQYLNRLVASDPTYALRFARDVANIGPTPTPVVPVAGEDPVARREIADEILAREAGDVALGQRIDALPPPGLVDQDARDAAAAAQSVATANKDIIGAADIPNTLPTIGRYIQNFVSGIQNAADAASGADAKAVAAQNAVGTEAQARADGDVALGARIDALPVGGGGGAGISTELVDRTAHAYAAPAGLLETLTFDMVEHEIVELIIRYSGFTWKGADVPTLELMAATPDDPIALTPPLSFTPVSGGPVATRYAQYLAPTAGSKVLNFANGVPGAGTITAGRLEIFLLRAEGGGGTVDQQARDSIVDIRTDIGAIPAPIATIGGWIANLGQAVQLDADEEGTLNTKINGVNNRLVDEVTTRTASDATFTEATGRNALHIADEVTARTEGDDALGLRIDAITSPDYRPGVPPYKFAGSNRAAAVAAREEYFLGEVSLSQAYVNIFSAGAASRIRVTLDPSVPTQVGAAGNMWNLVLGVDHGNDSVTIVPNTPQMTFTLRLPGAGITLDQLANDLDHNSRLNAEVVGNGNALVDYTATWGPNPAVGSVSPFGNGGDQSTTERTAWRAVYEADADLTITLDYEDREEIQHWGAADWETVLTLIDPPLPVWSAGPSQNLFTGATRTAAIAARDLYSLRNTGAVQASRFLPLGTSPTVGVRVTLSADNAIGAVGNTWTLTANGAAFAGSNSALGYDVLQQIVGVSYNAANLTAESLAHLFNSTPGFSAELVGGISESAVGFIAAQIAGDFSGGVNAAVNPRTVWISDYEVDDDLYITLSYGLILERQVRRNFMWAPVDTIQVPIPPPAGVHLLRHDNAAPGENFQWWANLTSAKNEYIERTGGTINMPEVGSQYLSIPSTNSIIYLRISDGANNIALVTLGHLILPDGSRVASQVTVMVGSTPVTLTIESSGRVSGTQSAGGTVNTGVDVWVQ